MHRALTRTLLGLTLGLGLTLTTAATAPAAPSPGERVAAQAAAPDCSAEAAALQKAIDNRGLRTRKVKQARNDLRKAERAESRAVTKKAKRARHDDVVRAKRHLKEQRTKRAEARARVENRRAAYHRCSSAGTDDGPITAASPIQALCTAGVPQAVCDALAGLLPTGGTTTNPLSDVCAAVPEAAALCTALAGGTPTEAELVSLVTVVYDLLATLGLEELLADVLGVLGLGDLLEGTDLDALLDLLGLGVLFG